MRGSCALTNIHLNWGVMATFVINGIEATVEDGLNLVDAALELGIEIPHFCYHPGLSVAGNCRMCYVQVEINGRKGLQIACNMRAADGMIVETQSEEVLEVRKDVLEFLLINHPLDCPVCDKAGECDLQDYSFEHGHGESRFVEPKVVKLKKELGSNILLYPQRCVLCTRCIRFCDEIAGTGELGLVDIGVKSEIDVFPGVQLENRLAGNVVDICPVGALIDKNFLFQSRVWYLREHESICPGCSTGCNVTLDVHPQEGRIYRIKPRHNPKVNDYWMCDDGRHGCGYVGHSKRLKSPMIKTDGQSDITSWSSAISACVKGISTIVEKYDSSSFVCLVQGHATNEEIYGLAKVLRSLNVAKGAVIGRTSDEGDVSFASGFTIRAQKSANSRGAEDMLKGSGMEVVEPEIIWESVKVKQVKGMYVLGGGPELSIDEEQVKLLKELEFLIVQDILSSDVTSTADVVLSGASFAEKDGTFTNFNGHVQRIRQAILPPGNAKVDIQIIRDMADKADVVLEFYSPREAMDEISRKIKGYDGLSYDQIGSKGGSILTENS